MTSATLGWLAEQRARVHLSCTNSAGDHMAARHCGRTLDAGEALALWGADTTLEQIRARARCILCGEKSARVEVSTPAVKMGVGASSA